MLAFLFGIPVAFWLGRQWRFATGSRWWLAFASLLTANALFNPYVPIYDLLLIGPACFATVYYLAEKNDHQIAKALPGIIALVGLWYLGPHLSQSLATSLRIQLFPVALLIALSVQLRELMIPRLAHQPQTVRSDKFVSHC